MHIDKIKKKKYKQKCAYKSFCAETFCFVGRKIHKEKLIIIIVLFDCR